MTRLPLSLSAGALFAGLSLLASTPAAAATPKFCPQIFLPVCAVAPNGVNETYGNSCMARVARARILAPGRCLGPICFFVVEQVCARIPGHRPQTYSNLCLAEVAHATLIHKGPCK
jgi:hypothetical protein